MPASYRFTVHGRVQGVYFRQSTADEATRLGVEGWVRNCADGSATCAAARGPAPPIARQIASSPVDQFRIVTLAPVVLPEKFSRMWKKR